MAISRSESKKRKKEEVHEGSVQPTSSKKTKVHAQRKFAQGAALNSPSITPVKDRDKQKPSNNVSSEQILHAKRPNTEDFLTFLCFRRTSILPPRLDFFNEAYRPDENSPNDASTSVNSVSKLKLNNSEAASKISSKKNNKNRRVGAKQQPVVVQALKRKYHQQRLAKQKPIDINKLAQKVKGKNMIRTRSKVVACPEVKRKQPSAAQAAVKKQASGLRSGHQRTPVKKVTKTPSVAVKSLRIGLRSGGKILEGKSRALVKRAIKQTITKKTNLLSLQNKKTRKPTKVKEEGKLSEEFSSDDNEPLLAVKKPKSVKISPVQTRSKPKTSSDASSSSRPSRKTKEAAAVYMEMLTKKLVSPDRSGEDDQSSVDSFPELPNAKRNEQRESEIKAEAMAKKKKVAEEDKVTRKQLDDRKFTKPRTIFVGAVRKSAINTVVSRSYLAKRKHFTFLKEKVRPSTRSQSLEDEKPKVVKEKKIVKEQKKVAPKKNESDKEEPMRTRLSSPPGRSPVNQTKVEEKKVKKIEPNEEKVKKKVIVKPKLKKPEVVDKGQNKQAKTTTVEGRATRQTKPSPAEPEETRSTRHSKPLTPEEDNLSPRSTRSKPQQKSVNITPKNKIENSTKRSSVSTQSPASITRSSVSLTRTKSSDTDRSSPARGSNKEEKVAKTPAKKVEETPDKTKQPEVKVQKKADADVGKKTNEAEVKQQPVKVKEVEDKKKIVDKDEKTKPQKQKEPLPAVVKNVDVVAGSVENVVAVTQVKKTEVKIKSKDNKPEEVTKKEVKSPSGEKRINKDVVDTEPKKKVAKTENDVRNVNIDTKDNQRAKDDNKTLTNSLSVLEKSCNALGKVLCGKKEQTEAPVKDKVAATADENKNRDKPEQQKAVKANEREVKEVEIVEKKEIGKPVNNEVATKEKTAEVTPVAVVKEKPFDKEKVNSKSKTSEKDKSLDKSTVNPIPKLAQKENEANKAVKTIQNQVKEAESSKSTKENSKQGLKENDNSGKVTVKQSPKENDKSSKVIQKQSPKENDKSGKVTQKQSPKENDKSGKVTQKQSPKENDKSGKVTVKQSPKENETSKNSKDNRSLRKRQARSRPVIEAKVQRPVRQCSTGEKLWIETDDSDSDESFQLFHIMKNLEKESLEEQKLHSAKQAKIIQQQEQLLSESAGRVKVKEKEVAELGDHFTDSDEEPLHLKTKTVDKSNESRTKAKSKKTVNKTLRKEESMEELSKRLMCEARKKFNITDSNEQEELVVNSKNLAGQSEISRQQKHAANENLEISDFCDAKSGEAKSENSATSVPIKIEKILESLNRNDMIQTQATTYVTDTGHVMKYTYSYTGPDKVDVKLPPEPINTHGLDLLSEVAPLTVGDKANLSTERIEKWLKESMGLNSKKAYSDFEMAYKCAEIEKKLERKEHYQETVSSTPFTATQELRLGDKVEYHHMAPTQQFVTGYQSYGGNNQEWRGYVTSLPQQQVQIQTSPPAPAVNTQQMVLTNDVGKTASYQQPVASYQTSVTHESPGKVSVQYVYQIPQDKKSYQEQFKQKSTEQAKTADTEPKVKKDCAGTPKKPLNSVQDLLKLQKERKELKSQCQQSDNLPHSRNCKCNNCIVRKGWFKNKVMPVVSPSKVDIEKPFQSLTTALTKLSEQTEEQDKISVAVSPMVQAGTSTSHKTLSPPAFQQKKFSFLERMKERERKESLAKLNIDPFSPNNENSVYAFEPDHETTSPPFRTKRDSRTSSTTTSRSDEDLLKIVEDDNKEKHCSSSIAVQVNLDTESVSVLEANQDKSNEISTQTEVAEDDGDSHMFYIPLQSNTAEASSTTQQLIQGVALKVGTEGPMGPNQRVIMKAKLVTKPPTQPTMQAVVLPQQQAQPKAKSNKPPVGTVQPTVMKPAKEESKSEETSTNTTKVDASKEQKKDKLKPVKADEVSPSSSSSSSQKNKRANKLKENSNAKLVEAPTFRPTEKEFQDPLEYIEKIRPLAESYGLCKIIPPSNFKPDCKINDNMRFTAYNQYVCRMLHRWGPNVKEMMAIKKYLATQSISLKQPPWIGGIEVDLPRLYQCVQNCGGLMKVMEKKKWQQVADAMRIPRAAQDRVTKLDDIYCKYLLPYDTLSPAERQKLFDEVEADWQERQRGEPSKDSSVDTEDDESEDETYIDECEECIVRGKNMALNQFYRIARNTLSMWFKNAEPTTQEVETEYWQHVTQRSHHVCVHSGSIDSSGWGYGFPITKNNSFSKHPWNLKVLTNNPGSVLRSLGPVMGVTVPTLHVGMVFTSFCWYRDPHHLPWIEYLHSGANKIWYGISDDNSSVFREALNKLLPRYIKNKTIWLPSDTAMVPPDQLVEHGVSLCHTTQEPGQFILVLPRAFTSSICTGYLVSESVYFAQPSWLTTAEQVFNEIQESCEPTMFSLERLLFSIATDSRTSVDVLKQVLPMVWHVRQKEVDNRKTLFNFGLKTSERLPLPDYGNKKRGGGSGGGGTGGSGGGSKWAHDEDCDYECNTCRCNMYVSLVTNSHDECAYCLPHAIQLLTHKRHHLKYCKLLYAYSQEEMNEIIEKLEQRIETKSQKKLQSKKHE